MTAEYRPAGTYTPLMSSTAAPVSERCNQRCRRDQARTSSRARSWVTVNGSTNTGSGRPGAAGRSTTVGDAQYGETAVRYSPSTSAAPHSPHCTVAGAATPCSASIT